MPRVRVREIVLWTIALAALAAMPGCGTVGKLDPAPSRGVDLTGNWMLDRAASDDPEPLFDKLRPKTGPRYGEPQDGGLDDTDQTGPQGQGGGQRRGGRRQQSQNDGSYRYTNDSYAKLPVSRMLRSDIGRAEQVTIRQSAEEFSLDYGTAVRNFTPGLRSVVSAEWGVADQSSGWKGRDYVIEVKPQQGVASIEKFGLTDDGKHLVEELRLGGGDFPVVQLKRVYDHSDKLLPRAVPSND